MSSQLRVGHIYSPPTAGKDATIFDWFSHSQHIVETLKGSFLKVAHVLPLEASVLAVDAENCYESVYVDMRQQADLTPFTIPNGWKQLWVYTDNDLITRPVIQKDMEPGHYIALIDHCSSVNGSQYSDIPSQIDTGFDGTFLDDDFLSAISLFKGEWPSADTSTYGVGFPTSTTGNHMLPSTSSAVNMELPTPVPVRTEAEYNATPPDSLTFLSAPTTDIALASSTVPTSQYVMCDLDVFARGISYTTESLQSTFPKASACIRDASILAKQQLTINGSHQTSFCTDCKDFIVEMVTVAKHAGHSVKKCWVTNKTIALDMVCKQIIDIVHNERYKFVKFLKENCFTYAEDLRKKALGGYCLGDYHDGTVGPYITQLTGMTAWDDEVTNLSFACSSGKYYHRMPILVILALRILQPLRSQHCSLLDPFPAQYKKLPEHLIAGACGMYTIFFRRRLPGYPCAKISSEAFEREAAHHLELLRSIRWNTDDEAHRLNIWINTQEGPNGWLQDLRTVHTLCNFQALLTNGILQMGELADTPEENFTAEERHEHRVFQELLKSVAGLEECLMQGGDDEVDAIAELASIPFFCVCKVIRLYHISCQLTKGASGARGDDTKSLKGSVLNWITPKGQNLVPPLARNIKVDHGFHHERTGALLCPAGLNWSNSKTKAKLKSSEIIVTGDQWLLFLYADYHYDPEDPWNGLFRSTLLTLRHIDMSSRPPVLWTESQRQPVMTWMVSVGDAQTERVSSTVEDVLGLAQG
ncbi:uncharacterized protein EDB93DRAFT_1249148 [Suillus bovinus]|uniref:uncharacterized protein n=1 Tax=Suillus bovinus TaxID=48563 RepID=UPI001B884DEE|nr:uncharacterized protein EDB93DRAFT_1249148 [Suillus bovinus]KAG2152640.1 hypothetical protein EDB93DRAFT_1249148 [Suillus bovinus]